MRKLMCIFGVLMLGACGEEVQVDGEKVFVKVEAAQPSKGIHNPTVVAQAWNTPIIRLSSVLPKAVKKQTGCSVIEDTVRWVGTYNESMIAELDCSTRK